MDCIHGVKARQMSLLAAVGDKNGTSECGKNPTIVSSYFFKDFYEMISHTSKLEPKYPEEHLKLRDFPRLVFGCLKTWSRRPQ